MDPENKGRIIFIAPFWTKMEHIGRYRAERFVRWLVSENYHVTIIWSGWKDEVVSKDRWTEIEIRDPLRRFTRNVNNSNNNSAEVKQSKRNFDLRNFIQKIIFYFDRELLWSIWITKKTIVKNVCRNAQIVITSSPPESTHLASYILAKKYNLKLLMDMRDGWIDEPMRPYRSKWSLKKIIEKRWESKIIHKASMIIVTSDNWKALLDHRITKASNKSIVVTNAYPIDFETPRYQKNQDTLSNISLLHAGRFFGTRSTNKMSILVQPLYDIIKTRTDLEIKIVLLGNLSRNDTSELIHWKDKFLKMESKIVTKNRVTRNEMYVELAKANGLLLLAATKAFLPSKTFEYIKSAKPILAVTLKDSTIWQVGQNLPQMFLFDYNAQIKDYSPIEKFLDACKTGNYEVKIPEEYSEEYLSKVFLREIDKM